MGADRGAVDAAVPGVRHDFGQRHRHDLPDPGLAPSSEPAVDRVPVPVFERHIAPRRPAPKPPEHAVDDRAVLFGRPAPAPVFGLDRQQILQDAPFRLGEIAPAQACLQKIALNRSSSAGSITPVLRGSRVASKMPPMRWGGRRTAHTPADIQPTSRAACTAQAARGAAEAALWTASAKAPPPFSFRAWPLLAVSRTSATPFGSDPAIPPYADDTPQRLPANMITQEFGHAA